MARFSTTGGSGDGTPGTPGAPGADGLDGADALWNFTGAYNGGASYAIGDIVTYDGQLWYRAHANGGTVGNVPSESFIWNLLAAKGTDGAQGDPGTQGSPGLVYLGDFIAGNGYISNLAVVKGSDNNLYIAKASGELGSPIANPGQWELFLPKGETGSSITWSGAWDSGTNYPVNYAVSDNGSSYIKILTDPSGVFPLTSETQYWNLLAEGGSGSSADIADFVFTNVDETNSSITVTGNKELTIQSGSSEDLNVRAGDDLWLTADDNIVVQADDELTLRSHDSTSIITNYVDLENAEHEWLFGSQGYLTLPGGGEIINSPDSSGDGSGYSTLQLNPDNTLETDQCIVIDPTGPNHIHVRAGGTPDDSSADLFLGAELNNVQVSDQGREVTVRTRGVDTTYTALNANMENNGSFVLSMDTEIVEGDSVIVNDISYLIDNIVFDSPIAGLQTFTASEATFTGSQTYTFNRPATNSSSWKFKSDGYITGPAMGGLLVQGLYNHDGDLYLNSNQNVVLNGGETGGEFVKDDTNPDNQIATLGDISAINTGDITFEESSIIGGAGIIELVPDGTVNNDSFLVIQPTDSNHIHIRAGGSIDSSTAELILGGERTGVRVSDASGSVSVSSKRPDQSWTYQNIHTVSTTTFIVDTPTAEIEVGDYTFVGDVKYTIASKNVVDNTTEYDAVSDYPANMQFTAGASYTFYRNAEENYWEFRSDGYLSGPAEGGLLVNAIMNSEGSFNILSSESIILLAGETESDGVFINNSSVPNNRVATLGDIENAVEAGTSETSFTVNGGSLGTMPTFTGAPLFSGTYVKTGPLVHFQIQVDMDNITNFGTGQYYVDLPFPAKYGYQVREGCLHDISTDRQYAIGGHVFAGQSRLNLFFTDTNGQDQEFDHNSPVTLAIADNFHVSGTYISE
jgi:hypothetical protein